MGGRGKVERRHRGAGGTVGWGCGGEGGGVAAGNGAALVQRMWKHVCLLASVWCKALQVCAAVGV